MSCRQPAVRAEPLEQRLGPAGGGRARLAVETEAVAAMFVDVELDRPPGAAPAVGQAVALLSEQLIITRHGNEESGGAAGVGAIDG